MMRRIRWIVVGAFLGIAGYRKVTRASAALAGGGQPSRTGRQATAQGLRVLAATASWLSQRARQQDGSEESRGTGQRSFMRDVRNGMADYLDSSGR